MYAAVKRGDIATMRINGKTVVLTVPLLQRVGLEIDTTGHLEPPSPSAE